MADIGYIQDTIASIKSCREVKVNRNLTKYFDENNCLVASKVIDTYGYRFLNVVPLTIPNYRVLINDDYSFDYLWVIYDILNEDEYMRNYKFYNLRKVE